MTMNNKQKKFHGIDWESTILYTMLITGICLTSAALIYSDMNKRRALYKPGQSLSRTERAAVNALHDPKLEQYIDNYNVYRQDYLRELASTSTGQWPDKKLHRNKYMPGSKCAEPTIGEYHEFLKDYEQNVIERKYQELNAQLQKQK